MVLHGVEENSLFKTGNMKFLSEQMRKADKILSY
jgi:hypothetical protein